MQPTTIPCGQLAAPALVSRVASTMDLEGLAHPPYDANAGFCRFCGHALPYAFSFTRVVDGTIQREEYAADSPQAFRMQALDVPAWRPAFADGIALVWEKDTPKDSWPTIVLAANRCCAALTDDIFRQASAVVRTRAANIRNALDVQQRAKQIVAAKESREAARRLAAGPNVGPSDR